MLQPCRAVIPATLHKQEFFLGGCVALNNWFLTLCSAADLIRHGSGGIPRVSKLQTAIINHLQAAFRYQGGRRGKNAEFQEPRGKLRPTYLKTSPFAGVFLVVQHCLQYLFVAPGNQAHSAHDFQHCHLRLNILCAQTLSDYVNTLRMGQDVSPAQGVVH